ncbi:MAG: FkbM family methyltransferase [Actinobacteria bacterium]|nr:FkbM family methyltransferase [Actinomycetota bacterium]
MATTRSSPSGDPPRAEGPTDYRASPVGRKRSWHGAKKHVKRFLGWRIPNWGLRRIAAFRPELRRTGRLPAPAHVKEVEGRMAGARFVMLRPDRCVVAKELYWGNGRRPRPEDDFALELFATVARQADVMLDVGAYTGIFTLLGAAANPGLEAHAFELVPEVYRALFDNCVRNAILHRVTLHHGGLGEGGTMTLPVHASGSALPDFFSSRLHFDQGVPVRIVPLDSLLPLMPEGARVVMKVDVEGTENDVLAGGQRFLATFRPDILCEVLEGVADAAGLQALLAPHGYRYHLVRGADLLASERIEPHARFRDWFFTTRSPQEVEALGLPVAPRARAS